MVMSSVDEILTMVNIALGMIVFDTCREGDANGDRQITVDELLTAISHALHGCPPKPAARWGSFVWGSDPWQ